MARGIAGIAALAAVAFAPVLAQRPAPGGACSLAYYQARPGLTAANRDGGLTLTWNGDAGTELRARLTIAAGTPTIADLSARAAGASEWTTLGGNLTPDYRVVSGLRRITNQQLDPLAGLGIPITQALVDREKWNAFWDAPLHVPGGESAHNNVIPPFGGVLDQPGLPRAAAEITRAGAAFHASSCEVTTDGARITVSYPGVTLGVFEGALQFTIYRGTNLIKQEVIAKTSAPSVAYKYDAGLAGLRVAPGARVTWRDPEQRAQQHAFGATADRAPVTVRSADRIVVARIAGGSIAALSPPHQFFWARETSYNLGYDWYRQDAGAAFALGVRQAEGEEPPDVEQRGTEDRAQNFALRSARPGTWQRMPVFFYVALGDADAHDGAAAFTRLDRFKAVPGYQVMATHFHMSLVARARAAGGMDAKVPDLEVLKAAGVTIAAPIDGGGGFVAALSTGGDPAYGGDDPKWLQWSRGLGAVAGDPSRGAPLTPEQQAEQAAARAGRGGRAAGAGGGGGGRAAGDPFASQKEYYDTATAQSSAAFTVMPNTEMIRGDVTRALGGHSDLFISHPLFWQQGRLPGQPFVANDPVYGRVYRVANTDEMLEMMRRENLLIFMPHPRTKGSAGFPDGIKDSAHFLDDRYRGAGFRWGMGIDGSEIRLSEFRCLPLMDDMNNWIANSTRQLKYLQATSEMYQQSYGDDIYANNPVNYVRLASLPAPGDWTPIVDAMKNGDYFVTSGEVLITSFAISGAGASRRVTADVEWTFPLDFVEVVWGDGVSTHTATVAATDQAAFGRKHFEIPAGAAQAKWMRFAAWDTAGNGAFTMPVRVK